MPYRPDPVEAHAFWLSAPGYGEIRSVALPDPGPDDVLVRTLRSGVSRGTETLVFRGGVPAGQSAAMRAPFQEREFRRRSSTAT
jgi:NADPH:quinone reductase-like Zn-dependent oxidoreductase